ncbi:MAG: CBS domain-containing protein [Methanolinea sp.]|jgi:predicted transcriptional regulator|nr:CBS domain-containing protein [Methanolinea sp.]
MHIPTPEEIKARREILGMKQIELAEKAGISQSMVARIESGSVDPRVSTMAKIVHVLNAMARPRTTATAVMHTPVISVGVEDTITQAVDIMEKYNISQVPVLEKGVPVGCISESTIVNAIEDQSEHRTQGEQVKHYMESGFPTVPHDMDIETVIRILQHRHAVLVMDGGRVRGVITKHDLIPLIMDR